jgi:AcrR family transcriptional regulator
MHDIIEISRRQRKRQALHANLLIAADQLFRERGMSQTTVDDIAEAADVARQTVFNHFPYKEAFALELGAASIQSVAQRAHALLESGVPALEVLERVGGWVLDSAIDQPHVAEVVARELLHSDTERVRRAREHVPLEKLFEAILEQAREEGEIRDDLPLDVVSSRISSIITSVVAQVATCEPSVLRRNLHICFDMLFNGITKRSA